MARDPGSLWSPLPESGRQGTHVKDKFIVHSTSGVNDTATAIFNYFARAEVVVESTFIVGKTPADRTRQILDSSETADANLNANAPGISVEVCGAASEPFTDWQVSELIRLGRWAVANHPIALQQCPTPTGSGFGWHVMFGSPGPWTPVAKECPGPQRIAQLKSTVFPAIFSGDEMTPEQARQLQAVYDAIFKGGASMPYGASLPNLVDDIPRRVGLAIPAPTAGGVDLDKLADLVVARISAKLSS